MFLMETRKKVLFCQVKRQERIKNVQASKITVLACLDVRLRNPKTVILRDWIDIFVDDISGNKMFAKNVLYPDYEVQAERCDKK